MTATTPPLSDQQQQQQERQSREPPEEAADAMLFLDANEEEADGEEDEGEEAVLVAEVSQALQLPLPLTAAGRLAETGAAGTTGDETPPSQLTEPSAEQAARLATAEQRKVGPRDAALSFTAAYDCSRATLAVLCCVQPQQTLAWGGIATPAEPLEEQAENAVDHDFDAAKEAHNAAVDDESRRMQLVAMADAMVRTCRLVFARQARQFCAPLDWTEPTIPADQCQNACAGGLCYQHRGLAVTRVDMGSGRMMVRGEFVAPVSPALYSAFASDHTKRRDWDGNVAEVQMLEALDETCDVVYVATKRIASIFPRDYVNLRVIQPAGCLGTASGDREAPPAEALQPNKCYLLPDGGWTSFSASMEHPDAPEQKGRVRAEVSSACYFAQPLLVPHQPENRLNRALQQMTVDAGGGQSDPVTFDVWSRVLMFSEIDPKGWIPTKLAKWLAANVLPRTVEHILAAMLHHYEVPFETHSLFDGSAWKCHESALEYSALLLRNILEPPPLPQQEQQPPL